MNPSTTVEISLTDEHRNFLKGKLLAAYKKLAFVYGPLYFLVLVFYFQQEGGGRVRKYIEHGDITKKDFGFALAIVLAFAILLFTGFIIKDFIQNIYPFHKELKIGKCNLQSFNARKYNHMLLGKLFLYHPAHENVYIELSKEDFERIAEGERLSLITCYNSATVIGVQNENGELILADDFRF